MKYAKGNQGLRSSSNKIVTELTGFLKLPGEYKGLNSEQIIKKAKEKYFLDNPYNKK